MEKYTDLKIIQVTPHDVEAWSQMRSGLWPDDAGEHAKEVTRYLFGERKVTDHALIAKNSAGNTLGFIELSIRPFAEGCNSNRVAYIEGMFVEPAFRGRGICAALVKAAEEWGRNMGCKEMASDTEITNQTSIAVHKAMKFNEVNRVVCFKKELS